MPFFILAIIVQVTLVVHIIKTGRNTTWVFIVLLFPLVGALAYIFVELIPEFANSRSGHKLQNKITKTIDPNKALRNAMNNFQIADTVQNGIALAEQYLINARYSEAKALFNRYLEGIHDNDPLLMLGLARAQFGLTEYSLTVETLDKLIKFNPGFKSPEGHLLYAQAHENLGNISAAIHEYESLCGYYAGPEPICRLGLLHKSQGEMKKANELFGLVLKKSKISGKHYNTLHKDWVSLAKREYSPAS